MEPAGVRYGCLGDAASKMEDSLLGGQAGDPEVAATGTWREKWAGGWAGARRG